MTARPNSTIRSLVLPLLVLLVAACDDENGTPTPIGPGPGGSEQLLVLNSTGQTIGQYEVDDAIALMQPTIDLGAGFDGVSVDATETHAVTTVSAFGGSRVLFADLGSAVVTAVDFPQPEGQSADPSRATFDAAGSAWFAGRGSDAIYTAAPGDVTATRIATDVGTFIEVVVPIGDELAAVDANIDDDGGTFAPFGPSRVFVLDEIGAVVDEIDLPDGAVNAIDAVAVDGQLVVLLGGTFDPGTFEPAGDGGLVLVDVAARTAGAFLPLEANGVAIEAGRDGLVYVTSTNDFVDISVVSLDPATGSFVAGPAAPIDVRDATGAAVDCWVVTALEDGRLLCATFSVVEAGRLLLLGEDGSALDEVPSGFGTTDLRVR